MHSHLCRISQLASWRLNHLDILMGEIRAVGVNVSTAGMPNVSSMTIKVQTYGCKSHVFGFDIFLSKRDDVLTARLRCYGNELFS